MLSVSVHIYIHCIEQKLQVSELGDGRPYSYIWTILLRVHSVGRVKREEKLVLVIDFV